MSFNTNELEPYLTKIQINMLPVHPWNKMIKGKVRGKTPIHKDWSKREYKKDSYKSWIKSGYNLGCNIKSNEVVVDVDPRNFKGREVYETLADYLGFWDFEDLCNSIPTVRTGGGGYHFYYLLPEESDPELIREVIDELPGVEFKKQGRQVLLAGSRHPSGKYYTWSNIAKRRELPENMLEKLTREPSKNTDYVSGKGSLNGSQLQSLILDKLDVADYSSNDKWFPILCASHHVTAGKGLVEFIDWCTQDDNYKNDIVSIQNRWESLSEKGNNITVGTLIKELNDIGEDSDQLKTILSFTNVSDLDFDDGDEDLEETTIIRESARVASQIDLADIYKEPEMETGVKGKAVAMATDLNPQSSEDEIMRCLRLIKGSDFIESAKAQELLVANKVMKQASINKVLKQLDAQFTEDFPLLLAQKTLQTTFNNGKHLINNPNKQLMIYNKTHWQEISEDFLQRLVQSVLDRIKEKSEITCDTLSTVTKATRLAKIATAKKNDYINSTERPKPIINCKNGELWLNEDGTHDLRPHKYNSYLSSCLGVSYNPAAQCPLFMETITDIFAKYPDTEDLVRHMGEIMGYIIQPYKNIASWFIFKGPGGDGKSTLLKILGGILGDAQRPENIGLMNSLTGSGDDHACDNLVNALNVIIEELPVNYVLKDAPLKMLSESTTMSSNPKHVKKFKFTYSATLIMCTNGNPNIRDVSFGMKRRANIIEFNRQFEKDGKDDLDRPEKILGDKDEMAGVLNFMLEGLHRLRSRGRFEVPKSCAQAKENWFNEANNVARFTSECFEAGAAGKLMGDFNDIYSDTYVKWCEYNSIDRTYRKQKSQFKLDLTALGFDVRRGGGGLLKVYGGTLKNLAFMDEFKELEEF